jgi:hypothetical protein
MPSYIWDSAGGQAYIYYRRSVNEAAFYQRFAQRFDIVDENDHRFGGSRPPGL